MTELEALNKLKERGVHLGPVWSATRCGLDSNEPKMVIYGDSIEELHDIAQEVGIPFETTPWDVTKTLLGRSLMVAVRILCNG